VDLRPGLAEGFARAVGWRAVRQRLQVARRLPDRGVVSATAGLRLRAALPGGGRRWPGCGRSPARWPLPDGPFTAGGGSH